jgi:hypothetical protein
MVEVDADLTCEAPYNEGQNVIWNRQIDYGQRKSQAREWHFTLNGGQRAITDGTVNIPLSDW